MTAKNNAPSQPSATPPDPSFPRLAAAEHPPLYEIVRRHIAESIVLGKWPPGMVLPGEVELARQFGVAVGTVRRALTSLTEEGQLTRRRKTGTVVTGRGPYHNLKSFFQFFRLQRKDGALVRSQSSMLSIERGPSTETERRLLQRPDAAEAIRIHRLRSIDGRPTMHDRYTIMADRVPDFPADAADVPELLYLHLLNRYGIRISGIHEEVTAEVATEEDLALLSLHAPSAVMNILAVAFDQFGKPVLLGRHRADTSQFCYVNDIR